MKLTKAIAEGLQGLTQRLYRCDHELDRPRRMELSRVLRETYRAGAYVPVRTCETTRSVEGVLLAAISAVEEIGLRQASIAAILLYHPLKVGSYTMDQVRRSFGDDTALLLKLLLKLSDFYEKNATITSHNFSYFLFSFAEDIRIILILITDRLLKMRLANLYDTSSNRVALASEVSFLYAPLAHRLGLYTIKGEMEDLCLKFTDRETFDYIKHKLNETKASRDAYIRSFIEPIRKRLREEGLAFDIKGRTKSISSICNKLKKQDIEFEAIYDLFAIRVVLDAPPERERSLCWQVYSIITDMYRPNPKRLKDWISVPKSNGYESLHITVMGPSNSWVEVQIRTRRMDEVAEKGVAAHWKYKGIKSERGVDDFLTGIRNMLESHEGASGEDVIRDFKLDLYDREIYVFTPKGDLINLPKGATVLDFAFAIHSALGERCVSGRVNGKNVSIRHRLSNGDSVSVVTSSGQQPKADWLQFVVTTKARVKIKQSLREQSARAINYAKEELHRRLKNRKLDFDEGLFTRLVKRSGYKTNTDFFIRLSDDRIDMSSFIESYKQALDEQNDKGAEARSGRLRAEEFVSATIPEQIARTEDILLIDKDLSGIEYTLAKCCNPIYGDQIFAFTSRQGIKVHKTDCPNAPDLLARYGYRVLRAKWSGKGSSGYEATLHVVGHDDIAIVSNITGQIGKESRVTLRKFNIESTDGLFSGYFTLYVQDLTSLNALIKKLKTLKGIKSVERT